MTEALGKWKGGIGTGGSGKKFEIPGLHNYNSWNKTHRNHGESKKNKQRNEPISKCPKYEGQDHRRY